MPLDDALIMNVFLNAVFFEGFSKLYNQWLLCIFSKIKYWVKTIKLYLMQ